MTADRPPAPEPGTAAPTRARPPATPADSAILADSGASGSPARRFEMFLPGELRFVCSEDDDRYDRGEPNAFDVVGPVSPPR